MLCNSAMSCTRTTNLKKLSQKLEFESIKMNICNLKTPIPKITSYYQNPKSKSEKGKKKKLETHNQIEIWIKTHRCDDIDRRKIVENSWCSLQWVIWDIYACVHQILKRFKKGLLQSRIFNVKQRLWVRQLGVMGRWGVKIGKRELNLSPVGRGVV